MQPWADIASTIASATGRPFTIAQRSGVGGGCVNTAFRIDGAGQRYFVKLNAAAKADMFAAEAAGLAEIARSGTVRVPQPVCHGVSGEASWLALEFIALERDGSMRKLGEQLAALHRVTGETFGWQRDNTIGATPQINTPSNDWIAFWREHRLGYQLRLAAANGYCSCLYQMGARLMEKLPALLGGHQPLPSLLHGDLWSGNVGFDETGNPVIFDPAVYYGDREADLAMTELFGGFGADFYAAYNDAYPLVAGYSQRKTLYNLYHVLNHLNLFGGGYLRQSEDMIARLLTAV